MQCESQPVFSENFGSLQVIRLYDQGAKHTAVCLICTHFVSETNTSVSVFIHTFPVKVRVAFQQHIGMCTGSLFYLVQQYVLCTLTSPISDTDFRLFGIIRQYFLKKRTKQNTKLSFWGGSSILRDAEFIVQLLISCSRLQGTWTDFYLEISTGRDGCSPQSSLGHCI